MEARQKAAEKMKKLSRTKTDSVESNSMEDGGEGKQLTQPKKSLYFRSVSQIRRRELQKFANNAARQF